MGGEGGKEGTVPCELGDAVYISTSEGGCASCSSSSLEYCENIEISLSIGDFDRE